MRWGGFLAKRSEKNPSFHHPYHRTSNITSNLRPLHRDHTDSLIHSIESVRLLNMSAISKQQRVKGDAFLSQAKSTIAKKTWFASSSEQKYEEAAEFYEKAANAYKVGGFHTEAGDAFMLAAKIYKNEAKNHMEAGKCLTSAGE